MYLEDNLYKVYHSTVHKVDSQAYRVSFLAPKIREMKESLNAISFSLDTRYLDVKYLSKRAICMTYYSFMGCNPLKNQYVGRITFLGGCTPPKKPIRRTYYFFKGLYPPKKVIRLTY